MTQQQLDAKLIKASETLAKNSFTMDEFFVRDVIVKIAKQYAKDMVKVRQ